MAVNRNDFKPTPISLVQEVKQEEDKFSHSSNDHIGLVDGINKIRFCPKHPDASKNSSYMVMKGENWCDYWDDEAQEAKRRPFLNEKIHLKTKTSIFDLYIETAKELLLNNTDEGIDGTEKWKKMVQGRQSIKLNKYWVAYVVKITKDLSEFGLFDVKASVRNAMNDYALTVDPEEAGEEIEPYTHPDTGLPVLITYNSKAKKIADYYKTKIQTKPVRLEDRELELLLKSKPLDKLFHYTRANFDDALEALKYYDDVEEIGIFENENFLKMLEEHKKEVLEKLSERIGEGTNLEETTKTKSSGLSEIAQKAIKLEVVTEKLAAKMSDEELQELIDEEQQTTSNKSFENLSKPELIELAVHNELMTLKMANKKSKEELIDFLKEELGENEEASVDYDSMDEEALVELVVERELATLKMAKKMSKSNLIEALKEDDEEEDDEEEDDEEEEQAEETTNKKPTLEEIKARLKAGK